MRCFASKRNLIFVQTIARVGDTVNHTVGESARYTCDHLNQIADDRRIVGERPATTTRATSRGSTSAVVRILARLTKYLFRASVVLTGSRRRDRVVRARVEFSKPNTRVALGAIVSVTRGSQRDPVSLRSPGRAGVFRPLLSAWSQTTSPERNPRSQNVTEAWPNINVPLRFRRSTAIYHPYCNYVS